MLDLRDVSVHFDGLSALDGISFSVKAGEILGMIGPNGSGKSTAFNVITGTLRSYEGRVIFNGEDVTGLAAHRIARKGIARTFQVVRPFPQLTALENVLVGRLYGREGARRTEAATAEARDVLERVGLADKAAVKAQTLTIFERKSLELGRALASRPRLMLLDEFMAGIATQEIPRAVNLIQAIRDSGVTIVIVEHIIKAITGLCDRVIVLEAGRKLAEGSVQQVVNDPDVVKAYLGTRHALR